MTAGEGDLQEVKQLTLVATRVEACSTTVQGQPDSARPSRVSLAGPRHCTVTLAVVLWLRVPNVPVKVSVVVVWPVPGRATL
jgi:hypothetical protein